MEEISTHPLEQFRQRVYQNFNNRADTLMELVDALSSNTDASSVVELSLNPAFRRHYTALYKGVAETEPELDTLAQLMAGHLSAPAHFPFWLLGVDVTSQPRLFSPTLQDRHMVYHPNQVRGNKPITVGHRFSSVALLAEREATTAPWVVPLATARVASVADKEMAGARQLDRLLSDERLPVHDQLCVEVGDTHYSKAAYLHANGHHENLVTIARARHRIPATVNAEHRRLQSSGNALAPCPLHRGGSLPRRAQLPHRVPAAVNAPNRCLSSFRGTKTLLPLAIP